jgi:hypothetical protein
MRSPIFVIALVATTCTRCALAAEYEQYIPAPSSRNLHPVSVHGVNGTIEGAEILLKDTPGNATLRGSSFVTYDFGLEIGGISLLRVGSTDPDQYLGLTFSESSLWVSLLPSDNCAFTKWDNIFWPKPTALGISTVPPEFERGGFRYLTLVKNTTGSLELQQLNIYFTPMPQYQDNQLREYTGFFHYNSTKQSLPVFLPF